MSKMSNLDTLIQEATEDDYLAYQELTQEVNSFLRGQLTVEQLSLKAIGILEEAGLTPLTDGKDIVYNTDLDKQGLDFCPNCNSPLRTEGEEQESGYCDTCDKHWTKA